MGKAAARILPLQHLQMKVEATQKQKQTLTDDGNSGTGEFDPNYGLGKLQHNRMRLYSYYKPSLVAGTYEIYAEQNIHLNSTEGLKTLADAQGQPQSIRVWNRRVEAAAGASQPQPPEPQVFEVVVPQFTLDPQLVNSYYPPDGHQDEARILPHICFNDPHLPWEREAGIKVYGPKDNNRSMVPWLALIVFDPDELRLENAEQGQSLAIPGFESPSNVDMDKAQNANGTFRMAVGDFLRLKSRMHYEAGYSSDDGKIVDQDAWDEIWDSTETMSAIFPQRKLFERIFENPNFDPSNGDVRSDNIESHKYLAHVRHINATGCPDFGIDQEGLFSVIISSRTGAIDITQPTPQICHLVSIEHVDSTFQMIGEGKLQSPSDRIGMVSLFSWIYMGLPPDPVNFVDTLRGVLNHRQVLRPDTAILGQLSDAAQNAASSEVARAAAKQLLNRFSFGYTIARWRTEVGQEVTAFNRGPLVPRPTPRPKGFPASSNTSKEFQVIDTGTGLIDLSYSSAWQLGKLLAISDTPFNSALMRFRSQVYNFAADLARKQEAGMKSSTDTIKAVADYMPQIVKMSDGSVGEPNRLPTTPSPSLPARLDAPHMMRLFQSAVVDEVTKLSLAGDSIYVGLGLGSNKPNSSDWVTIHDWVFEKMYLSDIPAHYLIPDPSFLPSESMRFFHIDDMWVDCLLDGALSVANHLGRDDDWIRAVIKATLNEYLKSEVEGIVPQIPSCGWILRSQVVKVMPDMRITVEWLAQDPEGHGRHPVCRYTRLDDQTIMALFDRPFEELKSITLAQPPHQQNFSLGLSLSLRDGLHFQVKHLFTENAPEGSWDDPTKVEPEGQNRIRDWTAHQPNQKTTEKWYNFDPGSRMLKVERMAQELNAFLNEFQPPEPGKYHDEVANSCVLALQLNNPSYYFLISPHVEDQKNELTMRKRQIYVGDGLNPPATSKPEQGEKGGENAPTGPNPESETAPGGPPKSTVPPIPLATKSSNAPTRMTTVDRPITVASPDNQLKTANISSQFTLSVFADYRGLPKPFTGGLYDPEAYIPTHDDYLFDIIFSVRRKTTAAVSDYRLKEILIDIPHNGMYKTAPTNEALVEEDYDGAGIRMLSNQRFVPFLNRSSKVMTVRLLPRSASNNLILPINDARTREISFKLAEPRISEIKNITKVPIAVKPPKKLARGFVEVKMYERYATGVGDRLVGTSWFVIKKDNLIRE